MIPFEPESMESIRARLPKALQPSFDLARPSTIQINWRVHMFDLEEGFRVMVTREKSVVGKAVYHNLHVSVSTPAGRPPGPQFADRVNRIPGEFFPDLELELKYKFASDTSMQFFFGVPKEFDT